MGASVIEIQRDIILSAVRRTTRGEWKVLVLDSQSKKLVDNVVKEDDLLNENLTNIELLDDKRPPNPDTDAVYLLSADPYVVDCLLADLSQHRYRRAHLLWTAHLDPALRRRIDSDVKARERIAGFDVLSIDFYPRESHLVTFRDPWSFPVLFHPGCQGLVRGHMQELAQKTLSLCVSMGEYPIVRYYRPRGPTHEASVLCSHLARFIQDELDNYQQYHPDFSPPSNRPRSAMYVVDRSIDLCSPLVHEFTYQAMAHELLNIRDDEKVVYKAVTKPGDAAQKDKEMGIRENDRIWVENRHQHMKDTIEKLMGDFQKFLQDHPHFAHSDGEQATSLSAIKNMLAGLPQFQELKEAYSLHLSMAQECMNVFQAHKLADIASVEQTLATRLDEGYRKPKNLAEQVVRLLDDDSVVPPDRLRLIMLYLLYRNGLFPADTEKLLAHAQLPQRDGGVVDGLAHLGARVQKPLKDNKPAPAPIFSRPSPSKDAGENYALSRFSPALKSLLEQHLHGTLDPILFPFSKQPADAHGEYPNANGLTSQASLRSAKPTWAKSRSTAVEPRQRIIVLMAGGATYAESRACYEISQSSSRDVFLTTSHMLTPALFLRHLGDLGADRRKLDLPADRPPQKVPRHLFEPDPPTQSSQQPAPPANPAGPPPMPAHNPDATAAALSAMRLGSQVNGRMPSSSQSAQSSARPGEKKDKDKDKKEKDKKKEKEKDKDKDKKKKHFFSSKK